MRGILMNNVLYLSQYRQKPKIDIAVIVESYFKDNGLFDIWQKKLQNSKNNNELSNLFVDFYSIIKNDVEHM